MTHPGLRHEPAAVRDGHDKNPADGPDPVVGGPDPAGGGGPDPAGGGGPDPGVGVGDDPAVGGAAVVGGPRVRPGWWTAADRVLRGAGAVLSLAAAVLSGLLELFLLPLRVHGQLVGVSILMALVGNVALAWFARHAVGRRWAVGLPWVGWTVVMFLAAGTMTDEGDHLLLASNWAALPMILLGSVAFGVYSYRLMVAPRVSPAAPSPRPGD